MSTKNKNNASDAKKIVTLWLLLLKFPYCVLSAKDYLDIENKTINI